MSGDIGEVLAIAASDARMNEILKRERSTSMLIYLVIVYLAAGVFLFVIGVILVMFLPILLHQGGNMAAMRGVPTTQMISGDILPSSSTMPASSRPSSRASSQGT